MSSITCFWIEPTKTYKCELRRYSTNGTCSHGHIHNMIVPLDEVELEEQPIIGDSHPHDDPVWPKLCSCGYEFLESDHWQKNYENVYISNDGIKSTLRDAPPGAMWNSYWMTDLDRYRGPDNICLTVRTPGGDWMIDAPTKTGGHWTRTGVPPVITANPSILIHEAGIEKYHGWLTNGFLIST